METIDAKPGEHIHAFLERMLEQAKSTNAAMMVVHNDSHVIVRPDSTVDELYAAWDFSYGK